MALVEALAEVSGKSGAYVHFGATSADILDTALALQMKDGLNIIAASWISLSRSAGPHEAIPRHVDDRQNPWATRPSDDSRLEICCLAARGW